MHIDIAISSPVQLNRLKDIHPEAIGHRRGTPRSIVGQRPSEFHLPGIVEHDIDTFAQGSQARTQRIPELIPARLLV